MLALRLGFAQCLAHIAGIPNGLAALVDADHVAVDVKGRSTRIAPVDRRIDLQIVAVRTCADVTAAG
jgi:hypothetical protein